MAAKKKDNTMTVVVVILGVILVGTLGFFGYSYMAEKSAEEEAAGPDLGVTDSDGNSNGLFGTVGEFLFKGDDDKGLAKNVGEFFSNLFGGGK